MMKAKAIAVHPARPLVLITAGAMLATLLLAVSSIRADDASDLKVAKALSNTLASVAEKVAPAVVHVKAIHTVEQQAAAYGMPQGQEEFFRRFFGPNMQNPRRDPRQSQPENPKENAKKRKFKIPSQGSGFIIDKAGHVITNNHVVEKAKDIDIILPDERTFKAKVIGRDPKSDIAVLQIIDPKGELPAVPFGDSETQRVGEIVMAIGAPFGLTKTVTTGIISAKGRVVGLAAYENYLQTDAAINPGNSGGPLINLDGQVIGINTAISSRGPSAQSAGVGFAIPSNMAKRIVSQLLEHGEVIRGWIGVGIEDVSPEMAQHFPGYSGKGGVLITQVGPKMPADTAGVKPGDIITSFAGVNIENAKHLRHLVASAPVEKKAVIKVLRKGKTVTLTIIPAKQPKKLSLKMGENDEAEAKAENEEEANQEISDDFGFEAQPLTDELAEQFEYEKGKGVIISHVEPGSPAAEKGLRRGMIIAEVGQEEVKNLKDLIRLMNANKSKPSVLLRIIAGNSARYIVLERNTKED